MAVDHTVSVFQLNHLGSIILAKVMTVAVAAKSAIVRIGLSYPKLTSQSGHKANTVNNFSSHIDSTGRVHSKSRATQRRICRQKPPNAAVKERKRDTRGENRQIKW